VYFQDKLLPPVQTTIILRMIFCFLQAFLTMERFVLHTQIEILVMELPPLMLRIITIFGMETLKKSES
jgi:hypothetical protein